MGIKPDIAKSYTSRWWTAYYFLLKASPWLASIFLIVISGLVIYIIQDKKDDWQFLGVQKISAIAVVASITASAIFFGLYTFISLMQRVDQDSIKDYFKHMLIESGIKDVFSQRGDSAITKKYAKAIASAQHRIWAFGMSNQSFFMHHKTELLKLLETINIEIRICFWDPKSIVQFHNGNQKHLIDIQNILEGQTAKGEIWANDIETRANSFIDQASKINPLKGTYEIKYLTLPTNISCLLVDDELFFFPFLSGKNSTQQPMLHISAACALGKSLVTHLDSLFNSVFSRKHEI